MTLENKRLSNIRKISLPTNLRRIWVGRNSRISHLGPVTTYPNSLQRRRTWWLKCPPQIRNAMGENFNWLLHCAVMSATAHRVGSEVGNPKPDCRLDWIKSPQFENILRRKISNPVPTSGSDSRALRFTGHI